MAPARTRTARTAPTAPTEGAAPTARPETTLEALREAAAACQACDLWRVGTQTVFGEGRPGSSVMLVGEQPGDREDVEGRPFVGPAGGVLDRGLEAAGIDRDDTYVTNMVKHFKWKAAGRRRLHQKPNAEEVAACRPWLEAELALVRPRIVVCLGATAAQALLGRDFRVTTRHGQWVDWPYEPRVTATVHPSSILRAPDEDRPVASPASSTTSAWSPPSWRCPRPASSRIRFSRLRVKAARSVRWGRP